MHTWKEDARRYDAPGFDLNDPAVASLFHIWQVDEATRSAAKAWMEAYLRQTADSAFTEIVLPNMALEVYEGFAQADNGRRTDEACGGRRVACGGGIIAVASSVG